MSQKQLNNVFWDKDHLLSFSADPMTNDSSQISEGRVMKHHQLEETPVMKHHDVQHVH